MLDGKIVIEYKKLALSLAILMLMFFSFMANTVYEPSVAVSLIAFMSSAVIILASVLKYINRIDYSGLVFIISFVVVLLGNYEITRGNYAYVLVYFLLTLIFVYRRFICSYFMAAFYYFLLIFGVIAAAVTFLCYLFPSIYTEFILPKAHEVYYQSLVYCFEQGYQPGFAVHYSSNGMFLSLLCGISFAIFLNRKKKGKLLPAILLIASVIALFLTAKRAHVLFSLATMLLVYYFHNSKNKQSRIVKIIGIVIIGVVLFIIVGQFIPEMQNVINRFIEAERSGDILNNRSDLYEYAIQLFLSNPIFGCGWGSYKYLRDANFNDYNHAHNVFLQLLAETGIVGFVIFVVLFAVMLINCAKVYIAICKNDLKVTLLEKRICCFAAYIQCFFILYCFSGNPLYDKVMWVPVVLSAAISMYIGRKNEIKALF